MRLVALPYAVVPVWCPEARLWSSDLLASRLEFSRCPPLINIWRGFSLQTLPVVHR